jgi:hypothetical protein
MPKNQIVHEACIEMPELASWDPQPIEECNLALGTRALCWVPLLEGGGFWAVCFRDSDDDMWNSEYGELYKPTHFIPLPNPPGWQRDYEDVKSLT